MSASALPGEKEANGYTEYYIINHNRNTDS